LSPTPSTARAAWTTASNRSHPTCIRQKEAEAERKIKRGEKLQFWNEAGLKAKGAIRYVD
jgi:hypothetical protein